MTLKGCIYISWQLCFVNNNGIFIAVCYVQLAVTRWFPLLNTVLGRLLMLWAFLLAEVYSYYVKWPPTSMVSQYYEVYKPFL